MQDRVRASGAQMANAISTTSAGAAPNTLAQSRLPRHPKQVLERLLDVAHKAWDEQLPVILHEAELVLARTPIGSDAKLEDARLTSIRSLGAGSRTFVLSLIHI